MRLSNCIFIDDVNSEDLTRLELVLQTTKSVMALTRLMPSVAWNFDANRLFVFGPSDELEIVRLSLRNALGLIPEGEVDQNSSPFDVTQPHNGTGCWGIYQQDSATVRATSNPSLCPNTDEEIPFFSSPEIAEYVRSHSEEFSNNIPFDEEIPFERWANHLDEDVRLLNDNARRSLDNFLGNSRVFPDGSPDEAIRTFSARELLNMSNEWRNDTMVEPNIRVEWQIVYDRLSDIPRPTASASGSFTEQEQIDYSEEHNPKHWNLVKVRYNGSRYYLSYICPPSVDMGTTLRVVGGVHACDTPEQFEICVYNTEPYWRELRHLMHRQAPYLREVVAA